MCGGRTSGALRHGGVGDSKWLVQSIDPVLFQVMGIDPSDVLRIDNRWKGPVCHPAPITQAWVFRIASQERLYLQSENTTHWHAEQIVSGSWRRTRDKVV